jgi:hypothetical protein
VKKFESSEVSKLQKFQKFQKFQSCQTSTFQNSNFQSFLILKIVIGAGVTPNTQFVEGKLLKTNF